MTSPFMVDCSVCHKKLAFGSIIRHMKTVHDEKLGKRWECRECGKVMQTEGRLLSSMKICIMRTRQVKDNSTVKNVLTEQL